MWCPYNVGGANGNVYILNLYIHIMWQILRYMLGIQYKFVEKNNNLNSLSKFEYMSPLKSYTVKN